MSDKREVYKDGELADLYVKYRPSYSTEIVDAILSFCRESETFAFDLALDLGCGSGQSTLPLAPYFTRVLGLDISSAQIARAPTHLPNVEFRVGPAEDLSFMDSGSVDLVTVAAALHWMDTKGLFSEVERVLKPGGGLVVYSYSFPLFDGPEVQDIVKEFRDQVMKHTNLCDLLQCVTPTYFEELSLPFPGWRRHEGLKMERSLTVNEFMNFVSSWTPQHKEWLDKPLDDHSFQTFRQRLHVVCQDSSGVEQEIHMTLPITMLMWHKPRA